MKKKLLPLGAMIGLFLALCGCETTGGVSGRVRENSATYAGLKTWEKRYIDRGVIAAGFTPDMVYMAVGRPSKKERQPSPGTGELWVFESYYPSPDARYAKKSATVAMGDEPSALIGPTVARGPNGKPGVSPPGIADTGGPQGGTMEPAALPSYTLFVLFEDGKITKVTLKQN